MKNRTGFILMLFAMMMVSLPLYAEHHESKEGNDGMQGKMMGMMGDKRGEGQGMMGMHQMMMKKMMERSVVATSDGGIVIVAGDKITKYDKNLKLVNEVETKIDMQAMGEKMKGMMDACPMMSDGKKAEAEKVVAPTPVVSDEDHAAHH